LEFSEISTNIDPIYKLTFKLDRKPKVEMSSHSRTFKTLFDYKTVTRDPYEIKKINAIREIDRCKEIDLKRQREATLQQFKEVIDVDLDTGTVSLLQSTPQQLNEVIDVDLDKDVVSLLESTHDRTHRREVDELGDILISSEEQPMTKSRKYSRERPSNWRDITHYYVQSNSNLNKTIRKYSLLELNANRDSWYTILGRWRKTYLDDHYAPKESRVPVYGKEIDVELAATVARYYENGIPITTNLLQLLVLDCLKKHNRQDLLDKYEEGKLVFSNSFATRFFKRHKLVSRKPLK
jgi:hypothetical protein